jgi:hypothetical protein
MARTKDETVRELAEWHFGVEPDLKQVIRIVADNEDASDEPIKLLEVKRSDGRDGKGRAVRFRTLDGRAVSDRDR